MPELYIQVLDRIIRAEVENASEFGRLRRISFSELPGGLATWQNSLRWDTGFRTPHLLSYERDLAHGNVLREELDRFLARQTIARATSNSVVTLGDHQFVDSQLLFVTHAGSDDAFHDLLSKWKADAEAQRLLFVESPEESTAPSADVSISYSPARLSRITASEAYRTATAAALVRIRSALKHRSWLCDAIVGLPFEIAVAFPAVETYADLLERFIDAPYAVSVDVSQFVPVDHASEQIEFVAVFASGDARSIRTNVVIVNNRTTLVIENPVCLLDPEFQRVNRVSAGRILFAAIEVES